MSDVLPFTCELGLSVHISMGCAWNAKRGSSGERHINSTARLQQPWIFGCRVGTDLSALAAARSPKHKDHLQLGLLS